ncbi:hypothetical protein ABT390_07510 [Streptomyces aurantiacus]|uniref:Uncharacterized protein n=1 Tax=Streptomyces aurantiacus JA 4570 TaxID=1286094 RepID=S3ZQ88_9ACTN|nr:hypothetical protein [Streptomyces aurantiacus]EPH45581.1 hypothetical protein STRAU_1282 [Streptomyces aurantiacus JA 4570]
MARAEARRQADGAADAAGGDTSLRGTADGADAAEGADQGDDVGSMVEDLLAPFDRVRLPRPATDDAATERVPDTPPPPPASARLPDAPPSVAPSGTPRPAESGGPDAPVPVRPKRAPSTGAPAEGATPASNDPNSPAATATSRTRAAKAQAQARGAIAEVPPTAPPSAPRARADSAAPPPRPGVPPRPVGVPRGGAGPEAKGGVRGFAERRTAAARRAVGAVDLTPGPDTGRPFVFLARPALYDDTTTRLRPVGAWVRPRAAAAVACVVLGLGLIGGAVTGSWLTGESDAAGGSRNAYVEAGELWHSVPVDELFPPSIKGEGAGPGGADRTWNRVAVAPDSTCKDAFDPLLRKALAPAGCLRLLRATYADATRSHVTTVGLLFTKADAEAMRSLRTRFTEEGLDTRPDLMPRPYAAEGTPAADFGNLQRATWTLSVLPDAPVVAYAVSGFADGRAVTDPEPAAEAMKAGATSAPAQAGLGNDAKGIADRVERGLRKTVSAATEKAS